ncbi:MAG: ECF-type sigma factor [Lysobacteraceae bacterium]
MRSCATSAAAGIGGRWNSRKRWRCRSSWTSDLIALDKAIAALAQLDPHLAQIVELRYFVGLEVAEIAHLFGVDERTVYREWAMARTWLRQRIE